MRHLKRRTKLGKTGSHTRSMMANMLKSLIVNERIETTLPKGKILKRHADKIITIVKKDKEITAKRLVKSKLRIKFNPLTSKEKKEVKQKDFSSYNNDRKILDKLFKDLKVRFKDRKGGYTRVLKTDKCRVGDAAQKCIVEYIK